ncbi:gas vesicle protein [Acrocarpospora phusangensis]|uniref:Gas vesicle protein n=1 Tax=Acrocarpospora phusangensis TaxID=1070424 RepID=A0A919URQ2_9ACTN|nr:gas vesicle protein GvpG [Acrocarpospora phusangensis]GIH27738.1 gas vesicle protein [Acrocarpospora phusangensis]
MGLLTSILGAPLAPLKGVIRLGELLRDEAERRMHDPAVARRELEEIDAARAAGEISEEEADEAMNLVLQRMTGQPSEMPEGRRRPGP